MRLIISLMVLGLVAVGCGDDDGSDDDVDDEDVQQELEELEDEAEETLDEGGARVAAEAVRTTLLARDLEDDEHLRDIAVLEDAVDDVPGDPGVSGLDDGDGDGRDDDGRFALEVGDQSSCVTVSEGGDRVDVEGGDCG